MRIKTNKDKESMLRLKDHELMLIDKKIKELEKQKNKVRNEINYMENIITDEEYQKEINDKSIEDKNYLNWFKERYREQIERE